MRVARRLLSLVLLFFLVAVSAPAAEVSRQDQVKAGLIYKFISFINWPEPPADGENRSTAPAEENDKSEFVIGILGNDSVIKAFTPVIGQPVKAGQRLRVEKIRYDDPESRLKRCRIIYTESLTRTEMIALLSRLGENPIVTVGSMEGFVDLGGVIGFSEHRGRLKFSINNRVARAHKIYINAKLLRVALRVVGAKVDE